MKLFTMGEITLEDELKLFDVKREHIGKVMEQLKSRANDALIFNLQWSDLEDHLKLVGDKIGKRFKELVSKELELEKKSFALEERAKVVEASEAELSDFEKKADGFRSEIEVKREELGCLRKSLEECNVEQMSKRGQLDEMVELLRKTQVDLDLKAEELRQMETGLESYRVEVNAEKEHLVRTETGRRELEEEIERKKKDLSLVFAKIAECEKLFEKWSSELMKTQVEVELKGKQLEQMNIDLERHRGKASAETELLDKSKTQKRELEEEIERAREYLPAVLDDIAECEKLLEKRSSELMKTHAEVELKENQLEQMNIDLERRRGEVNAEKEHLGRTENGRRELEVEIERKTKDLSLVLDKIAECEKLVDTWSSELVKTQAEVELKGKQLEQMDIDLERHRGENNEEMEHLDMSRTLSRELEEEIERKKKDRTSVLDEIAECRKQLESVEKQLDSQQKLLETRSSELVSKKKEYEGLIMDLDLVSSLDKDMKETCQQVESKAKELKEIERLINERSAHSESIKLLLQEHTEELALREKKYNEITEAIRKRSSELVDKEKRLERANDFIKKLDKKQRSKQKNVELTEENLERIPADCDSKKMELLSVKDKLRECLKNLEIKEREFKSLQLLITERNEQVEEGEKKKQHLDNSIEELIRQLQVQQEELSSFNKAIRESSNELDSKRKHLDQVRSSITDLTTDLYSVKRKIQEKEEELVKLKGSLMELVLEKKQFDARAKKIDLKEELDEKEKKLEFVEQKLAQCVKDYELKAKKLVSFCQQSNPDQHVDLVPDAKVCDEKTLQLFLHGHLKKCHQLYLDVSNALKASSEPEKLVLHTIQGLHQRMVVTNLDPNSVRRSIICLLECLIDMSPKPNTEVQEEAIKSATEWKNTTLVKANIPVEVLGCLHFLAAFSLAYTFDAEKVKNLFDVAFLRKYAPSMCEVLGVSSLAPVNNVQSLDDNPEQQLTEAPISNSSDFRCLDALTDEGSSAFSANEVFTGLQVMKDPAEYVLNAVNDELMGAQQRGELGLSEPIVKNLVLLLEELQRVVKPNDHLLPNVSQVANRWSSMMGTSSQVSPLEAWGFLQFIVAYGLVLRTDRDETFKFAWYVAHFKQAPKLFQSLGLSNIISYFVHQLLTEHHFIPAIRFMIFFKLRFGNFSPLAYLKGEIKNLRNSAKLKRRFDPQAEDKDAAKLKDIIELIEDFKLDIHLPVDLIVKFMVPRDFQTQNQCLVSSSVSVQPPQVHKQASNTVIQGSNPNLLTSLGASPTIQQFFDKYRPGGSTVLQGQSSHQAGRKRQRVRRRDPRPSIRPCFNPSGHGRF